MIRMRRKILRASCFCFAAAFFFVLMLQVQGQGGGVCMRLLSKQDTILLFTSQMREATDIFHASLCFTRSYSVSSIGLVVISDSGSDITQRIHFLYTSLAPGGGSQEYCNIPCHAALPLSSIASSFHVAGGQSWTHRDTKTSRVF